jgi:NAD+ synthase (glutamine-hydrolysing)
VKPTLKIALCQEDPTVGDLRLNADAIIEGSRAAAQSGATLAVFPELMLPGYPPEDLLLHPHFVEAVEQEAARVSAAVPIATIFGSVRRSGAGVQNTAEVAIPGLSTTSYSKCRLPNYGVFDEARYFVPGDGAKVVEIDGTRVGLSICEDIWHSGSPTSELKAAGAEVIVNISASPFHAGKLGDRVRILSQQAASTGVPVLYCSLTGGQDELVFDGRSLVLASDGKLVGRAKAFERDVLHVELADLNSTRVEPELGTSEEIEAALHLGLRDYVQKNGFNGVVFGISGGIDSAVVATLAVDALGPELVHAAVMPSPWSSEETQSDARELAASLDIELFDLPIQAPMNAFDSTLGSAAEGRGAATAAENIQARIRGNLLMALSNTHGWLVVTTGNKSELAVGYSTLYGDAAGGFGLLKDVPKQTVYELAGLRNSRLDKPIPDRIINRPPSAELRPDQKDEDSLPPYEVLDDILLRYVEQRQDADAIVAAGHSAETVNRILRMVDLAEYKRRQYPPGVKITPLAFGRDRRMPMTNGWRNSASN